MQHLQLLDTPIFIGDDALPELQKQLAHLKHVFILTDINTLRKCLPILEKSLPEKIELHTLAITPGEEQKNINTATRLWKQMMQLNVTRDDVLINLGGGVVSDIGAFVAGTFKRGISFINIPTSLLGMADAAIGNKAGVDFEDAKNMIGMFANPKAVFIHQAFLQTLEPRHIKNGFAEIIKHSLIYQSNLWKELHTVSFNDIPNEQLITDAVKIKIAIVKEDPLEKGSRKILNFGHTIGHAIESLSMLNDARPLLHGEAIAAGMICESWLSNQKTGLSEKELETICDLILKHFPKYHMPVSTYKTLMQFIRQDKKNTSEQIRFSLLKSIGDCKPNVNCQEEDIVSALNFYAALK